ncbi:MAG: bifunctional methylenetetrahydrofolate dehydrogenase/methenyltetrahydrofolate cyclohydrolase FolD [Deltaproteobacteria bacterium]|nr:MAG: bifunctional methylenetetrahydrofolate dehydrogenase/methenyltetrahydrofolate cyclohydrolase FolD [Deltaproteobacteria bacterium]
MSQAQIIDGKLLALEIEGHIAKEVEEFKTKIGFAPGLAVVRVGNDEASKVYVRNKELACKRVGFHSEHHHVPETISENDLLKIIQALNKDSKIHGILVQLPLPKHISESKVIDTIIPEKDADGFHPMNMGNLLIGKPGTLPCTPYGVIKMLESTGVSLEGKDAVVVGRSNIVGKPAALLLLQKSMTVTIAHSKTKNLAEVVGRSDVVIAAVGKAKMISGEWIKPGAIVIDVGINRLPDGKLSGDVDFEEAKKRAAFITPVPGGVGPMTIAMLLQNTLECAQKYYKL